MAWPTEPWVPSREQLEKDSDWSYLVAGGPGGQHRNRSATGVRLVHRPTGIVVRATERRSQHQNREAAILRLARVLAVRLKPRTKRIPTKMSRAAHRRRLAAKRRRSVIKVHRKRVRDHDE
jgi:protein subunit release factor B